MPYLQKFIRGDLIHLVYSFLPFRLFCIPVTSFFPTLSNLPLSGPMVFLPPFSPRQSIPFSSFLNQIFFYRSPSRPCIAHSTSSPTQSSPAAEDDTSTDAHHQCLDSGPFSPSIVSRSALMQHRVWTPNLIQFFVHQTFPDYCAPMNLIAPC